LLSRNELEKEIYKDVANHLKIGTIVLNGAGQIIESNEVAQMIAKDRRYLSLANDRVVFSVKRSAQEFNRIISHILQPSLDRAHINDTQALRIEGTDGSTLGGLIRPAPVLPWYRGEGSPRLIIYLADMQNQQFAHEHIVAQLFDLTRSEARLAMLLANGATLVEAAQQLNLTEGSVRVYSKRIFQKTGVNRQAELVRLILKSVALLAGPDIHNPQYAANH
jgi:DNA-binding CsgD family transcriptional regulator